MPGEGNPMNKNETVRSVFFTNSDKWSKIRDRKNCLKGANGTMEEKRKDRRMSLSAKLLIKNMNDDSVKAEEVEPRASLYFSSYTYDLEPSSKNGYLDFSSLVVITNRTDEVKVTVQIQQYTPGEVVAKINISVNNFSLGTCDMVADFI